MAHDQQAGVSFAVTVALFDSRSHIAHPAGDPEPRRPVGVSRRPGGSLSSASGERSRNEQERAVRALWIERGAAARDCRRSRPGLHRRGAQARSQDFSRHWPGMGDVQLLPFLSEPRHFPGGCFFEAALAEFDSKPGRVRDAVVEKRSYWVASLARAIREAKTAGGGQPDVDAEQVALELSCLLVGANGSFVQDGGTVGIERARRAIRDRLERIATPSAPRLPTR